MPRPCGHDPAGPPGPLRDASSPRRAPPPPRGAPGNARAVSRAGSLLAPASVTAAMQAATPGPGPSSSSQQSGSQRADPSPNLTSLYVGNLHPFVNEALLQEIFSVLGPVADVKVIKDKVTGVSVGSGFVKFLDHQAAALALANINGGIIYGQPIRVKWAFQKEKREDTTSHFHVYVGDLGSDITDLELFASFQPCGGCSDARVMWDHSTGCSKGYGFVSFRTREEAESAMRRMQGALIGQRHVRVGWAQHKADQSAQMDYASVDRAAPTNTCVYIGNIGPDLGDAHLQRSFEAFGLIREMKVYRKGNYGFVQFHRHEDAVAAILGMHGQKLGGNVLKCSWGRHQASQPAMHPLLSAGLAGGGVPGLLGTNAGSGGLLPGALPALGDHSMYLGATLGPRGRTCYGAAPGLTPDQQQQMLLAQQHHAHAPRSAMGLPATALGGMDGTMADLGSLHLAQSGVGAALGGGLMGAPHLGQPGAYYHPDLPYSQ